MSQRTITLTHRPPVRIDDDAWPIIAASDDCDHDGQVESQANCRSKWLVRVRRHQDGRAIVHAVYAYDTSSPGERRYDARRGVLLPADCAESDICAAISRVCDDIARAECHADDAQRWPTLAADCIADMPADTLE